MADNNNNYNQNQNRFKKIDYKLYFIISVSINVILAYYLYYLYQLPLSEKINNLVQQNNTTYKEIIKIKEFLK